MTAQERQLIRDLATRLAEVSAQPQQAEHRELWYRQNALEKQRPLIFVSPEGSWIELVPESALQCEDEQARGFERTFRYKLYAAEHFCDDQVHEAQWRFGATIRFTDWGFNSALTHSDTPRGAYIWDGAIKTRADLDAMQPPTAKADPDQTARNREYYEDLFGDILKVELAGSWGFGFGLIDEWSQLRGITQMFMDFADDPQFTHDAMRKLSDSRLALAQSMLDQNLIALNNDNSYNCSGAFGWSRQLPQPDFAGKVRLQDLWGFCDAQIMSEVSPAMHEEYVLQYQLPIMQEFGLNTYGCCEPLHLKLDLLMKHIPRLRRVSISPWADKKMSAEKLGDQVIYSWKPNPAVLAGVHFDADWARQDIKETIDLARANNCVLEIIMKDTHTCQNNPERFDQWCQIAREEAEQC